MKKTIGISLIMLFLFVPLVNMGMVKALTMNQPNDIVNTRYLYDYTSGDILGYKMNATMKMQMSNQSGVQEEMQQTHINYDRVNFSQSINQTGTNALLIYNTYHNNTNEPDFANNSQWDTPTQQIKTLNGSRFIFLNQSYIFPNDVYVKDVMMQNMSFFILPSLIFGIPVWIGYFDIFQLFKASIEESDSITGIVDENLTTYNSNYTAYNYTGLSTDHGFFIAKNDTDHYNISVNIDSATNITLTTFHSVDYMSSSFTINAVISNGTEIYDVGLLESFMVDVQLMYQSNPAPQRPIEPVPTPPIDIMGWFTQNWLWITIGVIVIAGGLTSFYIFRSIKCKGLSVESRNGKWYCPT